MSEDIVQLDLFDYIAKPKKVGRPTKIDKEKVFAVKDDLNKGFGNKSIMIKHNIRERTFFRIKKGYYDDLFKEAVQSSVEDFELELAK